MTTFQRIPRTRVSDAVMEQILALINSGQLKPGDRLPVEAELMRQTGAGRPSLRSALHKLESMRVIEIRQGVGAFVREDPPVIAAQAALPKLFSQRSIVEAIAVRLMLEPEIAAAAAEAPTEPGLRRLHDALRALQVATVDDGYPKEAHRAFHLVVAELTQNTLLLRIEDFLLSLWDEGLQRTLELRPSERGDPTRLLQDHQPVYEAIAAHDPALARQRMLAHIANTAERISRLRQTQPSVGWT